jgi:hypothetical protein
LYSFEVAVALAAVWVYVVFEELEVFLWLNSSVKLITLLMVLEAM